MFPQKLRLVLIYQPSALILMIWCLQWLLWNAPSRVWVVLPLLEFVFSGILLLDFFPGKMKPICAVDFRRLQLGDKLLFKGERMS